MNSKVIVIRLFCLLLIVLLSACEERFYFDINNRTKSVFIHGFYTQDQGVVQVNVQNDVGDARRNEGIEDAHVIIKNDNGFQRTLNHQSDGDYLSFIDVDSLANYWIEVELIDGSIYRSEEERTPSFTASSSLDFEQDKVTSTSNSGVNFIQDVVSFNMDVQFADTAREQYFMWIYEENYMFLMTDFPDPLGYVPPPCYVTQTPGGPGFYIFSRSDFNGNTHRVEHLFTRTIDKSFLRRHEFNLYQMSISRSYYNYMLQVQNLTGDVGSIFDKPPGRVGGNIYAVNEDQHSVVGFFGAVRSDTVRTSLYYQDVDAFIQDDCEYNPNKPSYSYERACFDCTSLPRTSFVRPSHWNDVD
ncbi:MAG: DUF4249 family protein [Cyclobacteriaceae bacterium]